MGNDLLFNFCIAVFRFIHFLVPKSVKALVQTQVHNIPFVQQFDDFVYQNEMEQPTVADKLFTGKHMYSTQMEEVQKFAVNHRCLFKKFIFHFLPYSLEMEGGMGGGRSRQAVHCSYLLLCIFSYHTFPPCISSVDTHA